MFSVNLRLSNRKIALILLAFTAVVVFAVIMRVEGYNKSTVKPVQCSGETELRDYLQSFGIETGECTVDEITIPGEFNDVYKNYNEMQRSQGFDLTDYKGQSVKRYTFSVLNHPDGMNVFAEVLLLGKSVIGADIYSTELDGFISPLK